MTLKKLIRQTYLKIFKQFLICLFIFYLVPLSLSSVSNLNENNVTTFSLFFNVTSWVYLCIILLVIIIYNVQKLLKTIRTDIEAVYHKSLYLEQNYSPKNPSIQEFIETNQHINTMQLKIKEMIDSEKKQKKELMFQVSAAAHDLKTPLTVIRGNSEYLQTLDLSSQVNICLEDIETSSQQLDDYFNQFIQYSKTFYQTDIPLETYSVREILDSLRKQISPLLTSQAVFDINNLLDENTTVNLNFDLFSRAILNLVSNSLAYHEGDTTKIVLAVEKEQASLRFSIWNSRSTFSDSLITSAGKLFYQEDSSRKQSQDKHYGLGLAFVNRVAQLHNGSMELVNENGGAMVILCIPHNR